MGSVAEAAGKLDGWAKPVTLTRNANTDGVAYQLSIVLSTHC